MDDIHRWSGLGPAYVNVLAALAALSLGGLVWRRFYADPLAAIPGPLLGKLSGWYIVYEQMRGRATYTRESLHRRYGKVVRIGPNELAFSSLAAMRDIHGQSTTPCLKATFFYHSFTMTGTHSLFSHADRKAHGRVRRMLSHGFSEQGILAFEGRVRHHVSKFLSVLRSAPDGRVNLIPIAGDLFMDITSALSFDQAFGRLDQVDSQFAQDIQAYFNIAPLYGFFPLARYLPFGVFQAASEARPRILRHSQRLLDEFRERLGRGQAHQSLLRAMVEARDEEDKDSTLSDFEVIENAALIIIAGSETSATALACMVYELAKQPLLQKRLEEEIRQAFPNPLKFPNYLEASRLVFMNQVIQEVLRLYGPANTNLPRVSPGKVIDGIYVPPGTIVGTAAFVDCRDASIFPEPLEFRPERWEAPTPEMKIMHRPFGSGARNCIGMHQAKMQLLLAICALYQRFDVRLDPEMKDDDMIMRDMGLMRPRGDTLLLRVTERVPAEE